MLKGILALVAVCLAASFLTSHARAGTNCHTNCYWVGNQQHCNTTCY